MDNKIKVLLLSSINSAHTIKWANGLYSKGCDVTVFGLNSSSDETQYEKGINFEYFSISEEILTSNFGSMRKLLYIKALPKLKKILKKLKPDILHAHYASSYGLLGALQVIIHLLFLFGELIFLLSQRNHYT